MNAGREVDVVVVGGGLAGLTAGAVAAGEGAAVVVLDGHALGGRARTTTVAGASLLNQGPHALYRGGAAAKILATLGITPAGGPPATSGARGLHRGKLVILPFGPVGLARTPLLGVRSKARLGRLLTSLPHLEASALVGRTLDEWCDDNDLDAHVRAVIVAVARVATYDPDPSTLGADVAIRQLQLAVNPGVLYLDGGWQTLVAALAARCVERGATVREHCQVTRVAASGGGRWVVEATGGETFVARSVVVATGGPAASAALLGDEARSGWLAEPRQPVIASCLDLVTRREPDPPVIFGVDEPLYLSTHCPPAQLAPRGTSIVHVMRYGGAPDARHGRAELEQLAARAGITDADIIEARYLHRMTVAHARPDAAKGLAGRPPVALTDRDGLFVAGDWVGPDGWLADASVASGEAAGLLAAAHALPSVPATTGASASAAR